MIEDMERDVREAVTSGLRVCHGSCCHELQTKEQYAQHAMIQKLERYRGQAIETQNEEQANAAFVHCKIVAALLHHLQVWLLLKADQSLDAWNELVEAQDCLACALRFSQSEALHKWYLELLASENLLFPPQRFVSSSHCFGSAECTICNGIYGECEHVAGRLYMGEMCLARVRDICSVDHVAVVDQPHDKGCRCVKVKRGGHMYCTLTLRQLEEASDDRGDAELCILRSR